MQDFKIDVGRIEELQMINDLQELDTIFQKAKSTIVCGATVILGRKSTNGIFDQFEIISSLPGLTEYQQQVYKYLRVK